MDNIIPLWRVVIPNMGPSFVSGTRQETWEECCTNCPQVGHPKEHRRDSEDVETREIGREFPGI